MRTYTKNQVEAIGLVYYKRGLEDGRMPKDRQAELKPPTLEELDIKHPLTSSDDPSQYRKPSEGPSWLDKVPRGVP